MDTSKTSVALNAIVGILFSVAGFILGTIFLLCLLGIIIDKTIADTSIFIICLFFIAVSVLLIWQGIKIKKRIRRFKKYVNLISAEHITSLDIIANSTSQPVDFVRNDLQNMIDKKFFSNAYIDGVNNEIIIGRPIIQTTFENITVSEPANVTDTDVQKLIDGGYITVNINGSEQKFVFPNQNIIQVQQQTAAAQEEPNSKAVVCPGCGAYNTVITGQASKCEYCGSLLQ